MLLILILPEFTVSKPAISLSKELLPEALGPIIDTISFSATSKFRLSKILSPSILKEIPLILSFNIFTTTTYSFINENYNRNQPNYN